MEAKEGKEKLSSGKVKELKKKQEKRKARALVALDEYLKRKREEEQERMEIEENREAEPKGEE